MFGVTKWWYALPVDGPDKMYWGFPFAFMGEGFHTSMSYQFFIAEFLADFAFYFLVCALLYWVAKKGLPTLRFPSIIPHIIRSLALLLTLGFSLYVSTSNPVFRIKREYDWRLMTSGYVFLWQSTPRPDIMKYHPSIKKQNNH